MTLWKRHPLLVIALVALLLIVITGPVAAESVSVSGTLSPGGDTMPVIFVTTPNCTGLGATQVLYHTHTLHVDEDGIYTFSLSNSDFSLYLHSAGFNPANGLPTCLAADNSGSIEFSYALTANTTYIAVPFDDTFAQNGGSYTLTISGPGNISLGGGNNGPEVWPGFLDGRLNNYDAWATFVVYCQDTRVDLYTLNGEADGIFAYSASQEEIDAIDATAGNVLIKEGAGVRLYKLTTGELQFIGVPDAEGKVYNVVISAFPCGFVRSFFT